MKRRLLTIVSLILCLTCLFGCTESGTQNNDTESQTQAVTDTQTDAPTEAPTETQTDAPTESQTETQTDAPTEEPTEAPTDAPTDAPTEKPTEAPTDAPTEKPTEAPTDAPTEKPTEKPTEAPTEAPTEVPTEKPTEAPTETEPPAPVPGETPATETLTAKTYNLATENSQLRYIGRTKPNEEGIICDHSASGIEFQGYFTGDVVLTVASLKADTYFTVYIDGERVEERFCATYGYDVELKMATFEDSLFHKIKILKQTEIGWSGSTLMQLDVTGYLVEAPEDRSLYFEFYGDSLTSGFGNIGLSSNDDAGYPEYQDATQTYGFLFSETADADCSILAMSGVGLSVGYYDNPFLDYFSKYSHLRGDEEFSFEGVRVPDIVVIHLGANDETKGDNPNNIRGYGENTGEFKNNFKEKAKELVNYIREGYNSNVIIVWAYDPWEGVPNYVEEALGELGGEANGLFTVELKWNGIAGYTGGGNHPNVTAHETHAKILADFLGF